MKTTIQISGQINGNYTLLNAIKTYDCKHTQGIFNSHLLEFKTKKEAIQAMKDGYKILKNQDLTSLKKANKFEAIYYDASIAKILNN